MKKLLLILMILTLGLSSLLSASEEPAKVKNYMLVFEVMEYNAQLKDAVFYFFENVFQKGDQLIINTPSKLYGYSPQKLAQPPKKLANEILAVLKEDINVGGAKARAALEDMAAALREDFSTGAATYMQNRNTLAQLNGSQEEKLLKYAQIFRSVKQGENHLVMFFQKQMRPIPNKEKVEELRESMDTASKANETYIIEKFQKAPDFNRVLAAFKYSALTFHFLYLEQKTVKGGNQFDYVDNSGDFYSTFSKIAKETGGITTTSTNPSAFLKQVESKVTGKVETQVTSEEPGKEETEE